MLLSIDNFPYFRYFFAEYKYRPTSSKFIKNNSDEGCWWRYDIARSEITAGLRTPNRATSLGQKKIGNAIDASNLHWCEFILPSAG